MTKVTVEIPERLLDLIDLADDCYGPSRPAKIRFFIRAWFDANNVRWNPKEMNEEPKTEVA